MYNHWSLFSRKENTNFESSMLNSRYLWLLVILLVFTGPVMSQQVRVSASLERDSIWLGDHVKLMLVAEYPAGISVRFPQLKDSIGPGVEVLSHSDRDSSSLGSGTLQMKQSYMITAFDSGPHPIAPVRFVVRTGSGVDTVRSNALSIFVKVPDVDLKKGFADIKKPYGAPVTFKEIAPWIFGILLVATILFLLFYGISRRRKNIPLFSIPAKPKLPPHVVALEELDKLKEEQLWQRDKVKEYYTRLTDIIRVYLEERFEIPAMEQTTQEILTSFRGDETKINGKLYGGLQKTLETADLVKFAKYVPFADENHYVLGQAYTIVEETKPEIAEAQARQSAKKDETPAPEIPAGKDQIKDQP